MKEKVKSIFSDITFLIQFAIDDFKIKYVGTIVGQGGLFYSLFLQL